ncbi:hypothetical protein [Chitinophaga sp. MM2321]|uniref:hypothetical protein n=1 Tax=Chitinophaga sp. MM2321 TaxID=3137178 RepID=UPI0032D5780D
MKKVALMILLSSSFMLFIACRGKMNSTASIPVSTPDMLPLYLITLGNCQDASEPPVAQTTVALEREQVRVEKVKDALIAIYRLYNRQ